MKRIKGSPEFPFDIVIGDNMIDVLIGSNMINERGILVIDLETMEMAIAYNPEEARVYHFFDINDSGFDLFQEVRLRIFENLPESASSELELHELPGALLAGLIDVDRFRQGHKAEYKSFVPLPGYPLPKRRAIAV